MDSVKPAVCGVFCDDALKYTNTPFPDSENKSDENLAVAVLLFSSLQTSSCFTIKQEVNKK